MTLSWLYLQIVFYLYFPIIIFLIGWIRPLIAIGVVLISMFGVCFALKEVVCINKKILVPCKFLEIVFVWVLFAGILIFLGHGDLFPQDFDWHKHHAIFKDLLKYEWPVVYENDSMLTYYLGQYLVPVVIAKLFDKSVFVLNIMIPLWNSYGLLLVYLFLNHYLNLNTRNKKIIVLLVAVFWGVYESWTNNVQIARI